MDTWIIVLICFGAFIFLFMVYGLLLPRHWEVRETVVLDTPQEQLYDYLNCMKNWEEWTIWNKESNECFQFAYEGPMKGEGACQKWTAKRRCGKTKITNGQRPDKIEFLFSFGPSGNHQMKGFLELKPQGSQIELSWVMIGDAGDNPNSKIMAKMMKPYMAKDFRCGLDRLSGIVADWS